VYNRSGRSLAIALSPCCCCYRVSPYSIPNDESVDSQLFYRNRYYIDDLFENFSLTVLFLEQPVSVFRLTSLIAFATMVAACQISGLHRPSVSC